MKEFIKTLFIITCIATMITLNMSWYQSKYAYEWIMAFGFLLVVMYVLWDILIHKR